MQVQQHRQFAGFGDEKARKRKLASFSVIAVSIDLEAVFSNLRVKNLNITPSSSGGCSFNKPLVAPQSLLILYSFHNSQHPFFTCSTILTIKSYLFSGRLWRKHFCFCAGKDFVV